MARLRLGSLRTRLLGAFFLLSVLPLALGGFVVYKQGAATLKAEILERLSAVALLKSQQIEAWVKERRNDVKGPAVIPPFQQHVVTLIERAGQPEAASSYQALQQILGRVRATGEFAELFLVDAKHGKVLLSTDPDQEGKFKTDRPYFREGRERPFVQHVYYSLVLGKAVMAFSAPVPDSQGRTVAVLVGRAGLEFLDRLMAERSSLGESGRTFLVNKFNYFVSESLGRAEYGWKPVFTEGVKRALGGETGTGLYLNHEKRAVAGAYRWLPALGVALMAEVDEAEALVPVRAFRVVLIAVLALVAGVALLLGVDFSYEISKPVTRLVEAARAIGAGDLIRRVDVKRPDELAMLASAVNSMADDLLRSLRELEGHSQTLETRVEERTRELSVLLTVAGTVGSALDLTEILRRVAREVARLLDADMVGAYMADPDGTALRPVAGYHVPRALRDSFRAFPIPLSGHRFLEEAWESKRPVFSSDASADLRIDRETFRRFPHRSVLCVPVVTPEGPIGALIAVWWEVERRFAPEELRLIEGVASQTATAVANALLYEDLARKNAHHRVLFETARQATASLNLADILPQLARSATELIGADASSIRLLDRSGTLLEAVAHHGVSEAFANRGPIRIGEGVLGLAVEGGRAAFAEDLQQDARYAYPQEARAEGLRSVVVVGLRSRDRVIGTLSVYYRATHRYTAQEVDLLTQFANLAAIAIERARLLEELKAHQTRLEALLETSRQLSRIQPLEPLLSSIAEACGRLVGSESVGIRLVEGDELVVTGTWGDASQAMPTPRLKIGESLSGIVAATGEPLLLRDPANDPRLIPAHRGVYSRLGHRAFFGVPVKVGERVVGVLSIRTRREQGFSEDDVAIATAFASQAAIALENARLYRGLQERAEKLTALSTLTKLITSASASQDVFDAVSKSASTLLGAKLTRVWVADPKGEVLRIAGSFSSDPGLIEAMTDFPAIPYGQGVISEIFESRTARQIEDIQEDPHWFNQRLAEQADLHAFAGIPLISGDRAVGVLSVLFGGRHQFTPEDDELMGLLADEAAIAIERAHLFEDTDARRREAEALAEVGRVLSETLDPDIVGQQITDSVTKLLDCHSPVLYRLDPETGHLVSMTLGSDLASALGPEWMLPSGTGMAGLAVRNREPVATPNILTDPRVVLTPALRASIERAPYRSVLSVPLLLQGRVIGALSVGDREGRIFGAKEVCLAQAFADQAALALEGARLFRELRDSYENLQRAQQQLVQSEKFRALGEMAGGVAHDFNNLLTSILGRTQYLLLQLDEGEVPSKEVRRNLTVVERAALDGAETVRRLLEFTRATPRPGEAVAVDVNELLAQTVEVSRHRWKDEAEAKGKQIRVVLEAGEVPSVAGNPAELREVLLNLVLNAIEAMPQGGTLTLSSWVENATVCLSVRDTGIGMSEEIRQRVFDPFFTTKGPKSSGLGLSACYGIIHRHEGEIVVDSREGQGTTFTIKLPLRPAPSPQPEVAPTACGRRLRILIIDDETDVRETLQDILAAAGHEMYVAGSGAEGLEILERQPVDVVLTDLGMPGMTGWEVADRIRARWPHLKVALITGWGVRVEPEELEAHGVDFLIAKPFQITQILRTVSDTARSRESSEPESAIPASGRQGASRT